MAGTFYQMITSAFKHVVEDAPRYPISSSDKPEKASCSIEAISKQYVSSVGRSNTTAISVECSGTVLEKSMQIMRV